MASPAVLKIDIITDAKGTQTAIAQTDSSLGKLGSTASKAGALLKVGIAGAGVAAVALGKQAYDAASAVQQSFGALESVYGKSATSAKNWAKAAANDVGLATSQYADLSALLGAQLTNMGRSQKQAATESDALIRKGADLAATFGGSVADAVAAVSSALKGETDPIERYGASIKQSDVNARLAAQGLDKLTGAAAKQAQADTVLAMITEQTASSVGAFGRESNTAAGQQARLSANVENLKARLGERLLPVMTQVFEWVNTRLIPGLSSFASTMSTELGPSISRVGEFITGRLIPAARAIITWFVDRIVPNIRATVMPILAQLRSSFGGVSNTLETNSGNLEKLGRFIQRVAEFLSDLAPIVGKVIVTQLKIMSTTISAVITVISTLVGWIDSAIDKITALANAIANNPIVKGAGKLLGGLNPFSAAPVAGAVGRLAGRGTPLGAISGSGLTQAAAGGPFVGYSLGYRAGGTGPAAAIVDNSRTYNIDATGAIDPVATAERIRAILHRDDLRRGRVSTFAPATGWAG